MQEAVVHLGRAVRPFPENLTKAIAKKTLRVENEAQQLSWLCRFLEAKLYFPSGRRTHGLLPRMWR